MWGHVESSMYILISWPTYVFVLVLLMALWIMRLLIKKTRQKIQFAIFLFKII